MKQNTQTRSPGPLPQFPHYGNSNLCLYCGNYGHIIHNCFNKTDSHSSQHNAYIRPPTSFNTPNSRLHFRSHLQLDSGSDQSTFLLSRSWQSYNQPSLCLYCGSHEHLTDNCFNKSTSPSTSMSNHRNTSTPALLNSSQDFVPPLYRPSIRHDYCNTLLSPLQSQQPQDLNSSHLCLYCGRHGHLTYNCFNKPHSLASPLNSDTHPSLSSANPVPVGKSLND